MVKITYPALLTLLTTFFVFGAVAAVSVSILLAEGHQWGF